MTDDELMELCQAATPGPWLRYDNINGPGWTVPADPDERVTRLNMPEADAAFIVAAREALPALLVRVERLEAALSNLLGWECGGKEYIDREHYEQDGECACCTGAWPCTAIEALAVLDTDESSQETP